MASTPEKSESQNTRWWESYLVRYFLGFIVGAICVGVLASETGFLVAAGDLLASKTASNSQSMIVIPSKPDWTAIVIALGFLGLGYCYLASAPITVMHAGRYGRSSLDGHTRFFWFGWLLSLILMNMFRTELALSFAQGCIAFLCGVWLSLGSYCKYSGRKPKKVTGTEFVAKIEYGRRVAIPQQLGYAMWQAAAFSVMITAVVGTLPLPPVARSYLLFGAPIFWIGGVQYVVLWRVIRDEGPINEYYTRLIRARRMDGAKEVRDTYTHLREHSNSIFIVLIELCLLSLLIGIWRATPATGVESRHDTFALLTMGGLGIWMLPTVFLWSRANAIERFFAESPEAFLASKPHLASDSKESTPTRDHE
jgi:hypothetical protein